MLVVLVNDMGREIMCVIFGQEFYELVCVLLYFVFFCYIYRLNFSQCQFAVYSEKYFDQQSFFFCVDLYWIYNVNGNNFLWF